MKSKTWFLILVAGLILFSGSGAAAASFSPVIEPGLFRLLQVVAPDQPLDVLITLTDQVDVTLPNLAWASPSARHAALVTFLQDHASQTQHNLVAYLDEQKSLGDVWAYQSLWITNAIAVRANRSVIRTLATDPEVKSIVSDRWIEGPTVPGGSLAGNPSIPPDLALINAPAVWAMGDTGQGTVIASLDTGVDGSHPDLLSSWRGGTNSWFDPYGQHTSPADINGHGTWTMGIMVGGSSSGNQIGIAPGAKWIAAKIFNDSNQAQVSSIHQAYQWILDPDGNPSTNDAPNIVNNSWNTSGPGCDLTFEADIQTLLAAGILPVFSAGNYGPNSSSSSSPANNPGAFSVGSTDNKDVAASFSSRGPTNCGLVRPGIFPDVVVPGVAIYTTDLNGLYTTQSGTSFSAPRVSGAVALLKSAFPTLSPLQIKSALIASAKDLGSPGADNTYGSGRIDVLAAYHLLAGIPPTVTPSPTIAPTMTATPAPIYRMLFPQLFEMKQ